MSGVDRPRPSASESLGSGVTPGGSRIPAQPTRALATPQSKRRSRVRQRLPVAPTPLIGRDREVAAARQSLERPEVRLLTLTGPAGAGKTRLAIAVAVAVAGDFTHGT